MKIASPKLYTSLNEEALFRCQTALEQKDREDYEGAQETIRPLWRGVGELPERAELGVPVAAEVLLCSGILTEWIVGKNQIKGAQESAKNLITESSTFLSQLAIRDG